ncbi:MAG: hypothetical protein E6Q58_02395 [Niabella sp.]|nr:MAG: hypothetical protein E6Q58_02395 [Niabella sp.]
MWILYALLAAFLWALVNYIDKYIVTFLSATKEVGSLILYSAFAGFPVCLVVYLIFGDQLLRIDLFSVVLIIAAGLFYILGLIPYLQAIAKDEVSTIIPQFMLIPIFGLMFEFLFGHVDISTREAFGALLILSGVIAINIDKNGEGLLGFTIKKQTIFLMLISSLLIAMNAFIFKFISIEEDDFWLSAFWQYFGFNIAGLVIFVFSKKYRQDFLFAVYKNKEWGLIINGIGEAVAILGNLAFYFATMKDTLPIVQITSEGFQPLFVFFIGVLITYAQKMRTRTNLNLLRLAGNVRINHLFIALIMLVGLIFINI